MSEQQKQHAVVEEQRAWVIEHKAATETSWDALGKSMGIPGGTLSQFGSQRGYAGDEQSLADKVVRYRKTLVQQATLAVDLPDAPPFYETETTAALIGLLHYAQRGRLIVAAMGPGNSKTQTAEYFAGTYNNVFLATMSPASAGVATMLQVLLRALGEFEVKGQPLDLSERIKNKVRSLANPVIIVDEAQHLTQKAIDQLRHLNDTVGVGLALFGNAQVLQTMEGGSRAEAFAQLFSRVSLRLARSFPTQADADAFSNAWKVHGEKERTFIRTIAMRPGGLRGATFMIELAYMIASSRQEALSVAHMRDAWAQLSSRAAAA